MNDIFLSLLQASLVAALRGVLYDGLHFTEEETEAQRLSSPPKQVGGRARIPTRAARPLVCAPDLYT